MLIQIRKTTMVGGKRIAAGEQVDASEKDARYLLAVGKATKAELVEVPEKAAKKTTKRKPKTEE